jgi:ketosteroid isomerase-like protein
MVEAATSRDRQTRCCLHAGAEASLPDTADEALRDTAREMSQANVENLRAFLETLSDFAALQALSRGEADVSLLDPEVTYEDTVLPDHAGETYRGYEGLARATARWIEGLEDLTIELEQIVGGGDRLVSILRGRSRARYTDIEFETPYAYVWTFRDGRVIHFRSYLDPEEALQAAGLSEQDARADT